MVVICQLVHAVYAPYVHDYRVIQFLAQTASLVADLWECSMCQSIQSMAPQEQQTT